MPKNDIVRRRGDYPGEAGADWSYGATARPEADEHYIRRRKAQGLRGQDKQQSMLRDRNSDAREQGPGKNQAADDELGFPPDDESQWG